jgi:hypothetical protein
VSTIIWQDGFEYSGGATLSSVYGTGYLGGSIVTGGRAGGHALNGEVSVPTGLSAGSPVVVGFARNGTENRAHVNFRGPTGTLLATISVDGIGDIEASFPTAGTVIGPQSTLGDRVVRFGWRYIELQGLIAASGRLIAAVDGRQIFDISLNTGTQAIANVELWSDGTLVDDWYVASPAATPDFKGDYSVAGTPTATTGSTPLLSNAQVDQQWITEAHVAPAANVAVDQQWITEAHVAPKQSVQVDQQWIIYAVKNRKPRKPRPQVFG